MLSLKSARTFAVFLVLVCTSSHALSQEQQVVPTLPPPRPLPGSVAPPAGTATPVPAAAPGAVPAPAADEPGIDYDLPPGLSPYEKLLHRLEAAERRIRDLESAEPLPDPEPLVPEKNAGFFKGIADGFSDIILVHDPEVAAAREALEQDTVAIRQAEQMLFEPADEPPIPRYRRPTDRRWYEKYSIRGYSQFRLNEVTSLSPKSAPAQMIGDRSVGTNQNFLLRRARLILQGDISKHVYFYIQPDFANTPPGSTDATFFVQLRDWYTDVYVEPDQVNRFRIGLSKVPYGWENMQSSSNRICLDRNEAFNSAVRNERDLGVFYYWTPVYAQKVFRYVLAEGLKGSGNYGVLGLGVYNGQGGSFVEQNENVHVVGRVTWPFVFDNGQIVETSVQGYTGKYTVLGSAIRPLGRGASTVPLNTLDRNGRAGIREKRVGGTFILYPQPIGFQSEWQVGEGPGLSPNQTRVEERALYGGYAMLLAKCDTNTCGIWYPFIKWQYYKGGVKADRNAPYAHINETEIGAEWQIWPAAELTVQYTITDRTNTTAVDRVGTIPYQQFVGQLLRFQFQMNY